MTRYKVDIYNLDGTLRLADCPYEELEWSENINGSGGLSMSVDMWRTEARYINFHEGRRELYVTRIADDLTETLMWGGYIWSLEGGTDEGRVRVGCEGFFSKLFARLIDEDKNYTDVEQLDIVWDLIDFTQAKANGDMGITRYSPTASGVTRTIKYRYWERSTIGDAITELAALGDGFDFEIRPNKVWRTWSPRKGTNRSGTHTFELDVNIGNIYILRDARETASHLHAIGGGDGLTTCIAVASDGTASTQFGRLERVEQFGQIKSYPVLAKKAEKYLALHNDSTVQPQFGVQVSDPDPTTYDVGDTVHVVASAGFFEIDQNFRIIERTFSATQSGRESVTLHFDARLTP